MRLKFVKLSHFHGYRATTVIPIDAAITGIAGRNDDGKSTILDASAKVWQWFSRRVRSEHASRSK